MSHPPSARRLFRYREVVDDWQAFLQANHAPEPTSLRIRRTLTDPADVTLRLERQGFRLTPVPGLADYLQVETGPHSVAQTLEHWTGLVHIQQSVMALPSLALAPRPGDRVLDLCAAPGGKTAHLAELMGERGPLVAVDPKEKRLRGLMSNIFRLGCTNVLVVAADGRELPGGALFDAVLVDAPCSAEGNYRKQGGRLPDRTREFQVYVTGIQDALLRRGIELTRPGGSVVYSTCTFAPEENELVVQRILDSCPVILEEIDLNLPHQPGLTRWDGVELSPELAKTWRVYPHHLDSGGLFMARFRKVSGSRVHPVSSSTPGPRPTSEPAHPSRQEDTGRTESAWSPVPPAFPDEDQVAATARIEGAVRLLTEEYGISPKALEAFGWMVRKDNIWVQTAGEWPVERWRDHGGWRVVSLGLRAFRAAGSGKETPSNHLLGRLASHLPTPEDPRAGPRHRTLSDGELRHLLEGGALEDPTLPPGPVVLHHDGTLLGRGMVGRGGLRHEIPTAQARRLGAILEGAKPEG